MDLTVLSRVGPGFATDGNEEHPRLLNNLGMGTGDLQAKFQEAVYRGGVFTTNIKSLTLAATHASPLAAGTGTPILGIRNPLQSGKYFALWFANISSVSGTPGGPFYLDVLRNAEVITAAANGTAINNLTFASGQLAQVYSNTALTGGAAFSMLTPLGGPAAIALGAGLNGLDVPFEGRVVVSPGSMAALSCHAVGTTHVISASLTWEEVRYL